MLGWKPIIEVYKCKLSHIKLIIGQGFYICMFLLHMIYMNIHICVLLAFCFTCIVCCYCTTFMYLLFTTSFRDFSC